VSGSVEIRVVRVPSLMAHLLDAAPLVRLGVVTNAEGSELALYRYRLAEVELRAEQA